MTGKRTISARFYIGVTGPKQSNDFPWSQEVNGRAEMKTQVS